MRTLDQEKYYFPNVDQTKRFLSMKKNMAIDPVPDLLKNSIEK